MSGTPMEHYHPLLWTPATTNILQDGGTVSRNAAYIQIMRQEYEVNNVTLTLRNLLCVRDFSPDVLRRFLPRILLSTGVLYFGVYVNNLAQAWLQDNLAGFYEERWPPNPGSVKAGTMSVNDTVKLWDVGHIFLPKVNSTWYADMFARAAPAALVLRFIVCPGPYSLRWTILCRWFTLWGVLFFCRAFTVCLTPLPNPDATCKPRISFPDNIWMEAFANLPIVQQLLNYDELTCQDVLFSGHTVAITLSVLFFCKYIRLSPLLECSARDDCCSGMTVANSVGTSVLLGGYYSIIASHFHYTVDVLVAAMMTFLVVQAYHYAMRMAWLCESRRFCSLYRLLRWHERYAKDLKLMKRTMAMRIAEPSFWR